MREHALTFRAVQGAEDLARLETALRALSAAIAEEYCTERATLTAAVLGPAPVAQAILALRGDQTLGAVLYSPVFSTVRGAAGIYVSDLWVSEGVRGQGLGAQLLAQVACDGAARWAARWMRLAAYHHSHGARRFYAWLGFSEADDQQELRLGAEGFEAMIERAG